MKRLVGVSFVVVLVLMLIAEVVQAIPNKSSQELGTLNGNLVWNNRAKEWVARVEGLSPGAFTLTYLYQDPADKSASRVVAGRDIEGYDSGPILRSDLGKFTEYKICEAHYLAFSDKVVIERCTWHLPIH